MNMGKSGYNRLIRIVKWLLSGNTGLSSEALCACYLGLEPATNNHPRDPSDFERCKSFLAVLEPEEKFAALVRAEKLSTQWKNLAKNWERLERITSSSELYDEMEKLTWGVNDE